MEDITPADIEHYGRLVYRHALRVDGVVEMDFDDIQQAYTIKVWQALRSFDPARQGAKSHHSGSVDCRCRRCRYVFSCLKNLEKDLLKKKRRNELFLEALIGDGPESRLQSRDHFEARYLAGGQEDYERVEADEVVLPSTLSALERQIVVLLYFDHSQVEIRSRYDLGKPRMDDLMRSIRLKFEDWRPPEATPAPLPPVALAA